MDSTANRLRPESDLKSLLDLLKRDIFLSLNCHAIGKIESFNPVNQTAVVTIAYKKTSVERLANGTYTQLDSDYPLLLDVPVICLGGGSIGLTLPISQGDECLLLFNDRDIDNWHHSGQVVRLSSPAAHSIADAFALVGLRNSTRSIENYDTENAVLGNSAQNIKTGPNGSSLNDGTTTVKVHGSLVDISNAATSLKSCIDDLITQIKLITVTCAAPGNPSSVPINAAAFDTIKTKVDSLLG